tara:strand:- start:4373 stop:10813 length:6441 start_codon:yes stop_codon:yes gene_type:complete
MAELKRTFTTSRMNKDLDERLVPNGEYRDARNIEILNSDGSDVGSVQTCLGNSMVSDLAPGMIGSFDRTGNLSSATYSSCVGSIADDKTNKIYYLVSGTPPRSNEFIDLPTNNNHLRAAGHNFISSDIIVEYDSVLDRTLPVMVDIYNVRTELLFNPTPSVNALFSEVPVVHTGGLRIGMEIEIIDVNGTLATTPGTIITAIPTEDSIEISPPASFPTTTTATSANRAIVNAFAPRVLNFNKENLITGINIIDDMIFWTDGKTEPKKVNITRGKQGTIPGMGVCKACVFNPNLENPYTHPGDSAVFSVTNPGTAWLGTTHTELVVKDNTVGNFSDNGTILNPSQNTIWGIEEYVQEKHITVIKRPPLSPPKLIMHDSVKRFKPDTRELHKIHTTDFYDWEGIDPNNPNSGVNILPPVGMTSMEWNPPNSGAPMAYFDASADFRVDDILLLTDNQNAAEDANGNPLPFSGDDVKIRLKVIQSDSSPQNPIEVSSAANGGLQVKVLYINESYVRGLGGVTWYVRLEDSTESLYELKFPKFGYRYKYEDGEYSSFSPFSEAAFLPKKFEYDAIEGYNVGMTNGLKQLFVKDFVPSNIPKDVVEVDLLYKESDSPNIYTLKTFDEEDIEWKTYGTGSHKGFFEIKNDLIHAAVASNQLLRPWDNVPRKALAQEVTGNRLVYGNYLQNYNLEKDGSVIKPTFKTVLESNAITTISEIGDSPVKSLKSMRTYQLGVVYKDFYGRETPVLSNESAIVKVDSSKAIFDNDITIQVESPHPSWAHSFKYFVKEVSNEYYNLAMDRWYDADFEEYDGDKRSIWMSFPSEDRNKVDEETTLILKKADNQATASSNGFVETTPRYKILAIESEAPDFIKTTMETLGELQVTDAVGQVVGGSAGPGFYHTGSLPGVPLPDYSQIRIPADMWDESKFASLQNENNNLLSGKLMSRGSSAVLRFVANDIGFISGWYNISNISYDKKNDNFYTVVIDGFFKDELNSLFGNVTTPTETDMIANITVEIAQKTLENRPEFDGRFFIKIKSDSELKGVLGLEGSITNTTKWGTNATMSSYFLYGAAEKDSTGLALNGSTTYCESTFTAISGNYGTTTPHDLSNYPGWEYNQSQPRLLTYSLGTGSSCGVSGNTSPDAPFNGNTVNMSPTTNICDQIYFTPAVRRHSDWETLTLANQTATQNQGSFGGGIEIGGMWFIDADPAIENDQVPSSSSSSTTDRAYQMAEVGKGADIGNSEITISIAGGLDTVGPNTGSVVGQIPTQHQDTYDKLTTIGTKFRFAKDPDGIVYEIYQVDEKWLWNIVDNANDTSFKRRKRINLTLIEPGTADPGQNPQLKRIGEPLIGGYLTGSTSFGSAYSPCNYTDIGGTNNTDGAKWDTPITIEFVTPNVSTQETSYSKNPAVWETEPKENVGLDVYYEVSGSYPTSMCDEDEELYIQPGATVSMYESDVDGTYSQGGWKDGNQYENGTVVTPVSYTPPTLTNIIPVTHGYTGGAIVSYTGYQEIRFNTHNGSSWENKYITIETPKATNITIGDPVGSLITPNPVPSSTIVADIFTTINNEVLIEVSPPIPVAHSSIVAIPGGSIVTFTPLSPAIILSVTTPATVRGITGCAGPNKSTVLELNCGQVLNKGDILSFNNPDGTIVTATVSSDSISDTSTGQNTININATTHGERHTLSYYNCYSFGNGIESDRVRDLYNAVRLDKGVKASTTLAEQYKEEDRKSGMIFSGIYNSMNGVNRLNQFIMAENITKDLNPEHGSIQKLHQRDTDLITLCEDKVLKVLSNKDALFNADDTKNITATQNVLGNAVPFVGEYGISKNPESFASEGFRAYFTDQERGAVLRLSRDGLTPISEVGMKDWFADNLPNNSTDSFSKNEKRLLGSYDRRGDLYNLSIIDHYKNSQNSQVIVNDYSASYLIHYNNNQEGEETISFSEKAGGWVSFKSFVPETACSLNSEYYTGKYGWLWKHHDGTVNRNSLYSVEPGTLDDVNGIINSTSHIKVLFNDLPSIIKSFKTLNYEGTQSKVHQNLFDNKHRNQQNEKGWYVSDITTDQQSGTIPGKENTLHVWEGEFIEKEGKWFNYIIGREEKWVNSIVDDDGTLSFGRTDSNRIDTKELATQGIGFPSSARYIDTGPDSYTITTGTFTKIGK